MTPNGVDFSFSFLFLISMRMPVVPHVIYMKIKRDKLWEVTSTATLQSGSPQCQKYAAYPLIRGDHGTVLSWAPNYDLVWRSCVHRKVRLDIHIDVNAISICTAQSNVQHQSNI